jgi:signal transduction histidine kinase
VNNLLKNLKFRLLSGLFVFLFFIFALFYYLIVTTLSAQYNKELESILSTAIKNIKYEYASKENKIDSFEHIKYEFDIKTLYAEILHIKNNEINVITKSHDLEEISLRIDVAQLPKNDLHTIVFSNQVHPDLIHKGLKVGLSLIQEHGDEFVVVLCGIPFEKKNDELEQIKVLLFIGLSFLLFIILFVVYVIIKQSLAQTKHVVDEVKNITIESSNFRIKKSNIASEIDELIETFNLLIGELQSSYHKIKEFGQNASHELKTPLTILRGEIEVGLRKERSNEEYKEIFNSSLLEIIRLQEIIEKILFLSNNAERDIKKRFEDTYIDEILEEVLEQKKPFAQTKNIALNLKESTPLTLRGSPMLINIALANILDNSIKFSHENSTIDIWLDEEKIIIQDYGVGIAKEELEHVFDIFYRIDKSKDGSGLGLSIVTNILTIHDFKMHLESDLGKGVKTTIYF